MSAVAHKTDVGTWVKMSSAFHRDVPCSMRGEVLATHPEPIGPGDLTVRFTNGVTKRVTGYHLVNTSPPPPAPPDLSNPDDTERWLNA